MKQKGSSSTISQKVVYYCPMHPSYTSDKPGDCPICNMKLVKKETATAKAQKEDVKEQSQAEEKTLEQVCLEHMCAMNNCPMQVKVDLKPGERLACPVCGEVISTRNSKVVEIGKQIPASKHEGQTIMISPEKQQLIGVKTDSVKKINLTKIIRASGKIAYDPELVVAQEEFVQAVINQERLKDSPLLEVIERQASLAEAAENKLQLLGMSNEQIENLRKTKKADTSLYLPQSGQNVWGYISIYEYEIGFVKIGQDVEIEAVSYPGEKFYGRVISINPVLDSEARTNQVRVEIQNPDNKLKPEMFIEAIIKIDLGEKLAISEEAVLDTGIRKIVYLSYDDGILEGREVKLGPRAEGFYEVLGGVSEGDIVVTSGNFFIDSESKLKLPSQGEVHQHGQ
ncbi:MAG: efflux RND transporter periplasmic adaptor subunit [Candidatus Omnitrophota bacterium]